MNYAMQFMQEAQEQADSRFRDYCNYQAKIRSIYAEQDAKEQARAARKAARQREIRRARKWDRVWVCVGLAMFCAALYGVQVAGLMSPVLTFPLMLIAGVFVSYSISYIANIIKEERKGECK
jgi:Flp pilus assembly protein TadB